MRRIIRHILREEIENPKLKKYLDYIVKKFIDDVYITSPYEDLVRFGSVSELEDLNIFDDEIEEIRHNPDEYRKLGWDSVVDNDSDDYDTDYYFRINKPDYDYDYDEFYLEVIYDWLDDLTDKGYLIYDEESGEHGEWIIPVKDMMIRSKEIPNLLTPLLWRISDQSYDIPKETYKASIRVAIMSQLIKGYSIENTEEMEYVINKFYNLLPIKLKELGVKLSSNYDDISINKDEIVKNMGNIFEGIVDDFIDFGKRELSLGDDFRVNLTDNTDSVETLANYDIDGKEITVVKKNRAIPDIIRSIAHEMVHHNQNVRGDLRGNRGEGEEGSPWEDEANSMAGRLVRRFGEENPEIYDI